jgi:hypothetical protein
MCWWTSSNTRSPWVDPEKAPDALPIAAAGRTLCGVTTVDVQPEALLDAARVLYSAVRPSWFETKARSHVGPHVSYACDAFVQRVVRAAMTKELIGLARALEIASDTYVSTDTTVAEKAAGHGG